MRKIGFGKVVFEWFCVFATRPFTLGCVADSMRCTVLSVGVTKER